ncbi:hypothetical protein BDU57DRAFT_161050 [Ampelomyces quisqualis]|uniref:Arrestin-like N-terminal domain-containing protein n=1 Tax=Ampelomyces quisqualis TaxID=50730 RepID=A0A6A5QNF4_AMPQU|nr:hypothetical protein BDU57DRAFT_161050 [Ampelomyces quisqualis]
MVLTPQTSQKQPPRPFYIELSQDSPPFFTCGNTVRGLVRVEPTLRPQSIAVVFRGYYDIYDNSARGASTPNLFHYKAHLFQSSGAHENFDILRRGTANDGKVELPFEFTFPQYVSMAPPLDRPWRYSQDSSDHPRFQHAPGFPLPPSCPATFVNKGPLSPKVTYSLEAHCECVNNDSPKITVRHELKFLPPAPEYDLALLQPNVRIGTNLPKHCSKYKLIRTRKLFPGYEGSSKLGKVKDMLVEKELFFGLSTFSEVPYAKFSLTAAPARIMVADAPIPIAISVEHLERSPSLIDPPEVFMRRMRVQLLPAIHVFTFRERNKENVDIIRDAWTLFDKKFDDGNGEPLYDGLTLSHLGGGNLTHEKLLPSFTSYGLSLEYEIKVEIWGECAKSEFSGLAAKSEVQVVSSWNAVLPQELSGESGISIPELDSGPAYQEVDPLATLQGLGATELRHQLNTGVPAYEYHDPPQLPVQASRPLPPRYMG